MNLEITNKRLIQEVKTLASLLKMKIRVENGSNETYSKLAASIEKIIEIEEQLHNQENYYSKLEIENSNLRQTCDKFSELSESVQLLHNKYKQQVVQLTNDKNALNEQLANIRFFSIVFFNYFTCFSIEYQFIESKRGIKQKHHRFKKRSH